MEIHTVFFDFGNVIGFFDHRRATKRFVERSPLSEAEIFDAIYNTQLEDDFEAGRIDAATFVAGAMEVIDYRGTPGEFAAEFVDIFAPNPDICSLIPRLTGRYRLVLASNTNELHALQFRKQFADTLQHFDALGVSFEAKARKPHPPFFAHCQSLTAGPASGCLFIDDIGMNVEAARAFGWKAIHYKTQQHLLAEFESLGIQLS